MCTNAFSWSIAIHSELVEMGKVSVLIKALSPCAFYNTCHYVRYVATGPKVPGAMSTQPLRPLPPLHSQTRESAVTLVYSRRRLWTYTAVEWFYRPSGNDPSRPPHPQTNDGSEFHPPLLHKIPAVPRLQLVHRLVIAWPHGNTDCVWRGERVQILPRDRWYRRVRRRIVYWKSDLLHYSLPIGWARQTVFVFVRLPAVRVDGTWVGSYVSTTVQVGIR